MFQFIRRHQAIGLIFIGVVIVSFVIFFSPNQAARMARSASGSVGVIDGRPVERDEYFTALKEARLAYWIREGRWPERSGRVWDDQKEALTRIVLLDEARKLGIHATDEVVGARIADIQFLHDERTGAFSRAAYDRFLSLIQSEDGMTRSGFEEFMRHDLELQHLVQLGGLSGSLVTPREAESRYRSGNNQYAGQLVLVTASNYLAQVNLSPTNISRYYSNHLAEYRIPERAQVRYVKFPSTNFLAEADQQLNTTTNLAQILDGEYQQRGADTFKDTLGNPMTPEAAKADLKEQFRQGLALAAARKKANEFANKLYQMEGNADSLSRLAADSGLQAETTPPFDQVRPPLDMKVNASFNRQAFALSPDEPFATPFVGDDGVYLIAFDRRIPSEIQPFEAVEPRVIDSLRRTESRSHAEAAGRQFVARATDALAQGKGFEAAATEAGLKTITLTNFSQASTVLPELPPRLTVSELLRVASDLQPGKVGTFTPAADGGFVLFLQSRLPVPEEDVKKDLPAYLTQARQYGQVASFIEWQRKRFAAAAVQMRNSGSSTNHTPVAAEN